MFTNHISIIVTILMNIIGRAYVIISKVGESSLWSFITFALILIWLWNLKWQHLWLGETTPDSIQWPKLQCGVGSVHSRARIHTQSFEHHQDDYVNIKEKRCLHFGLSWLLLHMCSDSKTWNDNLRNLHFPTTCIAPDSIQRPKLIVELEVPTLTLHHTLR